MAIDKVGSAKLHDSRWNRGNVWNTFVFGFMFVSLACSRTFLIKFSIRDGKYYYLPVTVNIFAELLKFLVCCALSLRILLCKENRTVKEIVQLSQVNWCEFLKWSVPGLLYFMDNLLGFYILLHLTPALYTLMGNFVIISTAVLFRVLLRKRLSLIKWAALVILFLSIVALSSERLQATDHHHHRIIHGSVSVSEQRSAHSQNRGRSCSIHPPSRRNISMDDGSLPESPQNVHLNQAHVLVLIQCVLASAASVYNEKIFKEGEGMKESIYIQNTKLYLFGVIFNSATVFLHGDFRTHAMECGLFYGYNIHAFLLIIVTALFGLTVALILKFRDCMFQVMSFQLTNVIIITSSVLFLEFHPSLNFFLVTPIVLLAIFIYNAGHEKEEGIQKETNNVNYTAMVEREEGGNLYEDSLGSHREVLSSN